MRAIGERISASLPVCLTASRPGCFPQVHLKIMTQQPKGNKGQSCGPAKRLKRCCQSTPLSTLGDFRGQSSLRQAIALARARRWRCAATKPRSCCRNRGPSPARYPERNRKPNPWQDTPLAAEPVDARHGTRPVVALRHEPLQDEIRRCHGGHPGKEDIKVGNAVAVRIALDMGPIGGQIQPQLPGRHSEIRRADKCEGLIA